MKYNGQSGTVVVDGGKAAEDQKPPGNERLYTESEISTLRSELTHLQLALRHQTRRCRHLVTEYTRRLQTKELQYQSERALRNDQLTRILRTLLIFEARLKQEQKFLTHQLEEKDRLIEDLRKCKDCQESVGSSSEYCNTDFQSEGNFESYDSCSETYVGYEGRKLELTTGNLEELNGVEKKKAYFEVLKLENAANSTVSNDDNTSNDIDNLDSLTSVTEKISLVSNRIEGIFNNSKENLSLEVNDSLSESNVTVVKNCNFEDSNDAWYQSASDQEDDEHRGVYRDNPVLECMNQILLQNINDSIASPPKTPNVDRKAKNNKKVKFQDEEGYYETPIQKITTNFYELTSSNGSSNAYEQITSEAQEKNSPEKNNHYYIDMDTKSEVEDKVVRKQKILRVPPALPPKPANLLSKYKLQVMNNVNKSNMSDSGSLIDSEPDYCSISELNLPVKKISTVKKINVIAEINTNCENAYDPVIQPEEAKKSAPEIPKLPQVSEIIIPEEEPQKTNEERISYDNYIKNNSQILKTKPNRNEQHVRQPIMIGTSVSSLISTFNKQQLISELKPKVKKIAATSENSFESDFDLSQNFEEFKLDECEIEELDFGKSESDFGLSKNSVKSLKEKLEQNEVCNNNNNNSPDYEQFLECTGLSSKSILTPSRLLSNHKSMLKPKDVKLRSKVGKVNYFEKQGTIRYWSEPYI